MVVTSDQELPERRRLFHQRLRGEHAGSLPCAHGVHYQATFQVEVLQPEIFDLLGPAVYAGALRVLGNGAAAQDVVQEVFVQLWSHPDRYEPAAGSLR